MYNIENNKNKKNLLAFSQGEGLSKLLPYYQSITTK